MAPGQVACHDGIIPKAAKIDGFTPGGLVDYLRARGGNEDQWPAGVVAACELGRAIIHFEGGWYMSPGFTGKERVIEFLGECPSRFDGWHWEAPPSGRSGSDRRSRGTDDIDCHDRPSRPVPAHARR